MPSEVRKTRILGIGSVTGYGSINGYKYVSIQNINVLGIRDAAERVQAVRGLLETAKEVYDHVSNFLS
jgi:hypothetical protein